MSFSKNCVVTVFFVQTLAHKSIIVLRPNKQCLDTHIPIDSGYRPPDVESVNFCILLFVNSPGDHRAWVIKVSTRSIAGDCYFKINQPVGRRLMTSQPIAVNRNNKIVLK